MKKKGKGRREGEGEEKERICSYPCNKCTRTPFLVEVNRVQSANRKSLDNILTSCLYDEDANNKMLVKYPRGVGVMKCSRETRYFSYHHHHRILC